MKSIRIFVACSVGVFVGSIIALQMYQMFWWVGVVVGAFVAYIGYNIEEVIAAIPVAYHRTINWRPNQFWSCWCAEFMYMFNLTVNIVVGFCLIGALVYWRVGIHNPENNKLFFQIEGIVMLLISVGFGTLMGLVNAQGMASAYMKRGGELVNPLTCPNFFRFYFWMLPRGIIMGSVWLISNTPKGVMIVLKYGAIFLGLAKTFLIESFRLIHSKLRLLCAVDAALGTAIGYFTGNALIGTVAGGLLGVVNYEIITVRVMKLAGARSLFK